MHVQIRLANLSFLRMQDADSEGSDSEAEYISTTCLPHQPVPTGIAHSMPSGASRGPPPGFERPAPQVQLTPLSCSMKTESSGLYLEVCSALHIAC